MSDLDLARFRNALAILMSIDRHELPADMSPRQWEAFRDDPYRFFLRADDRQVEALWRVIEARQPERLREEKPHNRQDKAAEVADA